ncbi:DUF924 family protein [Altererythrobacter gangjinensis]|uniref:DUF924 family protein n=1 Tax=Pontixanthobacter gangjinensis TaxID=1028742 RepID=A0A6I4SJY2_9SPHN|nr:DUF924 family protein [Pontixanthobacter gangjinensis]
MLTSACLSRTAKPAESFQVTDPRPGWAKFLLQTWFEELGPKDWFGSSDAVDAMLRERFEDTLHTLSDRPASDFQTGTTTAQAAILLFDQVPRNLYRGTAQAFAYDPLALQLAKDFITSGRDAQLPDAQRQFIAMPLMHSEELSDQDASLAYFTEHLPDNSSFAKSHHEMIERFSRFPHRNEAIGRSTTKAEQRAIDDGFSW